MKNMIRLSATRFIRYRAGDEHRVRQYLISKQFPQSLIIQVNIQLGILAAIAEANG